MKISTEDFKYLMEMLRSEKEHWESVFEENEDREAGREISFWKRTVERFKKYE